MNYKKESEKNRKKINELLKEGYALLDLTTGTYLKKGYGSIKLSAGQTYQARKMWEEEHDRPFICGIGK